MHSKHSLSPKPLCCWRGFEHTTKWPLGNQRESIFLKFMLPRNLYSSCSISKQPSHLCLPSKAPRTLSVTPSPIYKLGAERDCPIIVRHPLRTISRRVVGWDFLCSSLPCGNVREPERHGFLKDCWVMLTCLQLRNVRFVSYEISTCAKDAVPGFKVYLFLNPCLVVKFWVNNDQVFTDF